MGLTKNMAPRQRLQMGGGMADSMAGPAPMNPTMTGGGRFITQIAGQTGGNQYNGGAPMSREGMRTQRFPKPNAMFGGMQPQPQAVSQVGTSPAMDKFRQKASAFAGQPRNDAIGGDIQTLDDSFLGGKLSSVNTMPGDIRGLRGNLINYLNNPGRMMAGHEQDYGRTDVGMGERLSGSYGGGIPQFGRGDVRDVSGAGGLDINAAPKVNYGGLGAATPDTQSLDQLGPGSQFFNNINSQLSPVFAQRRAEALAQAKESAGNLTGSGFANILGRTVNKSLAEENASLLDYGTRAAMAEQQRQGASADRFQNRAITDAGYNLRAQEANQGVGAQFGLRGAELGLDAAKSNQGADMNFINQLLSRGGQSLQADELGLRRDMGNQENTRSYNQFQGSLDSNRLANIYNTRTATNNANAGRFSDNLGRLSTTGVGPNELVSSGGAGAMLGPLGQLLGSGGIGSPGGGGFFGGGGVDGKGSFGLAGDLAGKLFGRGGGGDSASGMTAGLGGGLGMGGFARGALGKLVPGAAMWGAGDLIGNAIGKDKMAGKAASAAGKGAAIGSIIPGVGTVAGGLIGAATPYAAKAGKYVAGKVGGAAKAVGKGIKKLFSDERLKENIEPLGSGLYVYNFIGSPRREVGFLAQEVKRVLPSAVSRDRSGYYKVDYSKTTSILNALSKADRL